MAATCKAISHGSLMGARGNSGVILSQVLRGLVATRVAEAGGVDGPTLARGAAARRPTPPTRRSCARSRARSSPSSARPPRPPRPRPAGGAPRWSTCSTPPAPRRADALGAHARHAAGAGRGRRGRRRRHRLPAAPRRRCCTWSTAGPCPSRRSARARCGADAHRGPARRRRATATATCPTCATRSCTSSRRPTRRIPRFKDVWAGIGDSIVVVGGDGIWNCHIHTDDIGAADRGGHRRRPAPQDPGHRPASSRSRRSAGSARPAGAIADGARRTSTSRSPPRWWPSPPATASGASSTRSACRGSWPAASR